MIITLVKRRCTNGNTWKGIIMLRPAGRLCGIWYIPEGTGGEKLAIASG
jgi:hypothetical protein